MSYEDDAIRFLTEYKCKKERELERKFSHSDTRRCPDQCVGTWKDFDKNDGFRFPDSERKEVGSSGDDRKRLIIVLESPHRDEFSKRFAKRDEPGPAFGVTGRNIRNYIWAVLKGVEIPEDTEVVLMNAIQYQCSLGEKTGVCRDEVFDKLWWNKGEGDFENRIRDLARLGDVIFNCCTRGKGRHQLINEAVEKSFLDREKVELLVGTHPCIWHWRIPDIEFRPHPSFTVTNL
ncbi:MAG: hypothetical protein ACREPQ_09080 [Rhodanobacter sp.]